MRANPDILPIALDVAFGIIPEKSLKYKKIFVIGGFVDRNSFQWHMHDHPTSMIFSVDFLNVHSMISIFMILSRIFSEWQVVSIP